MVYAQGPLRTRVTMYIFDYYRVSHPSCHPQVSLCAICQNPEESPELATPGRVQHLPPPKNAIVQNSPPLNSPNLGTLPYFGGGKSWTLPFLLRVVIHFRGWPVQDSGFWHIGKFGGGKKDETFFLFFYVFETPCI